nr:hypothetical protein BaRGS_016438 [Batillaria attramentaria]
MNMTTLLAIINHLAPEDRDQLLRQIDMGSEDELKQLVGSAMQPTHVNAETMYMQFPEYRAHKLLRLYIPPILLLLGTFGNIFSFLILRNKASLE